MTTRRAMTKVAQGLAIVALVGGAGGAARAQTQPGYPPAPVQSGPQPSAPPASAPPGSPPVTSQPGAPGRPAPPVPPQAPPAAPPNPSPDYPPPQYPPEPPSDYPPQAGPQQPYAAPPGYPQQPYAAPPGYPQQPYYGPGYPQQPYPPPGYYQQPYEQQGYPPPGYPPGYYPPGYAPPGYEPPPPPPTRPHGHGGLLLLPYVGLHVHEGTTGEDQDAGFRLGSLLGYRVNGQFSLNAELTIDVLNIVHQPAGTRVTGAEFDLALSPLFHFDAGALELVLGPKLGIWGGVVDTKDDYGTIQTSATGLVVGGSAGAFLPLGNGASLGGLVSFVVRTVSNTCLKRDGGAQTCMDTHDADSEKVLGFTGAVLF